MFKDTPGDDRIIVAEFATRSEYHVVYGFGGTDTLNGGNGNYLIFGGTGAYDLRDLIFAGCGDDFVNEDAGNDLVYGQDGNDTIAGGLGADDFRGRDGNDVLTSSAFSDLMFGVAGTDKFLHVGIEGRGSGWVQGYTSADGDVLFFGNASVTRDQYHVNFARTRNAEGERAGDKDVQEAFVFYRRRGQNKWVLVDGEEQSSIKPQIGARIVDHLI